MYEGWQFERWDTLVSDIEFLTMISLTEIRGIIRIVVQGGFDLEQRQYCIEFEWSPAYRNIQEQYRLSLWKQIPEGVDGRKPGNTLIIPESKWIESFCGHEPIFELDVDKYRHYMICTGDDVIEVIANAPPKIYEVEPGKEEKNDEVSEL